ncbi:MAG TPA: HDIG domain-containing protein [Longimicrobiales bacterium]
MNRSQERLRVVSVGEMLSSPPSGVWHQGLVHHGARILLLLALAVLITVLFPPRPSLRMSGHAVGTVAEADVVAQVRFDVPRRADEVDSQRRSARAAVAPVFNFRAEASDTMVARLDRFFADVDSALAGGDPEGLDRVLAGRSIALGSPYRDLLRDEHALALIRPTALRAAREILPAGVADGADLSEYGTTSVNIREGPERERLVFRSAVLNPTQFFDRAVQLLPEGAAPEVQQTLRLLLIHFLDYSLELNGTATQVRRDDAANAVSTVERTFLESEIIVRRGEAITAQKAQELDAHETALAARGLLTEADEFQVGSFLGAGLINLLLLLVFGLLLFFFRPDVYSNFRWVLLLGLLIAVYVMAMVPITRNGLAWELLPVTFVAFAVAVLWDGRLALVLALVLAVLSAVQPPFSGVVAPVLVTTLVGGAAAALSVRAVRRRAQAWLFGAIVAAAYGFAILGLTLTGARPSDDALVAVGWAAMNALVSAILAMGVLPVFELLTGITTDQTLLEWADPNRSLLKRLSMEAPGTYAHTINVANLAEAAAGAVGANGLLCRVGLYYHDVGKMLKPHYFVENQPDGRNPHDRLKPDTSAAIVKEHVTEGFKLAQDANVPAVISSFILEHHGTQQIGFFWEKAKEEEDGKSLDPEDFRYPGPRPRSKETAIAMLADSAESATRALQDPTQERVRDLIHSIVAAKIADGQLDESPLTLAEIALIQEQFVKVLSGIYHHRIDYPQTKHLTEAPAADAKGEAGQDDGVAPAAPSENGATDVGEEEAEVTG